jgi:hypothetical protein
MATWHTKIGHLGDAPSISCLLASGVVLRGGSATRPAPLWKEDTRSVKEGTDKLDSLKLIHGQQWREQLVEEIRTAQRALELLAGLERRLKERDRSDLEEHLGHLERLAGSLPEAHPVRLLVEGAVRSARARGAGYAGSAASRSRSKTEGRLSTLRGSLSRLEAFASIDA